jgi:hypothetical protein
VLKVTNILRLLPSAMWHPVVCWRGTSVSEELTASIVRVEEIPEDRHNRLLHKAGTSPPHNPGDSDIHRKENLRSHGLRRRDLNVLVSVYRNEMLQRVTCARGQEPIYVSLARFCWHLRFRARMTRGDPLHCQKVMDIQVHICKTPTHSVIQIIQASYMGHEFNSR